MTLLFRDSGEEEDCSWVPASISEKQIYVLEETGVPLVISVAVVTEWVVGTDPEVITKT